MVLIASPRPPSEPDSDPTIPTGGVFAFQDSSVQSIGLPDSMGLVRVWGCSSRHVYGLHRGSVCSDSDDIVTRRSGQGITTARCGATYDFVTMEITVLRMVLSL
jgi:hypothetical protein